MELKDLLTVKSRKQRMKERDQYNQRIFHLGQGHRDLVQQRMRSLIKEPKTDDELLYAYACVKDFYLLGIEKGEWDRLCRWYDETYLYPADKKKIITLVRTEGQTGQLIDYPEAEVITRAAKAQEIVKFLEAIRQQRTHPIGRTEEVVYEGNIY